MPCASSSASLTATPLASTTGAPFVNNNNLHIPAGTSTQLESGGVAGLGIVTDYDGDTFGTLGTATAPDIGFDEFAGSLALANDIARQLLRMQGGGYVAGYDVSEA